MHLTRRRTLQGLAALAAGVGSGPAFAADFPLRTIRLIVPYPPGGPTDVMGRFVAEFMARDLKQSVIVDNKPGANGIVGAEALMRAEPDGHTIFMTAGSVIVQNPLLYKKLVYDPPRDFRMLALMTDVPVVMVVHPSLPVTSVQSFVAYAKANPGKLNFGSAGNGGTLHLAGERFKATAGIEMTHIPYKGAAPALNDLLAGQIQVMFDTLNTSLAHIRAGSLKALGVTSKVRVKEVPDVPTIAESGYPDYTTSVWFAAAAPKKVPDDVAAVLTASLHRAMADPELREKLEKIGFIVQPPRTSSEITAFLDADRGAWAKVITAQGITLE